MLKISESFQWETFLSVPALMHLCHHCLAEPLLENEGSYNINVLVFQQVEKYVMGSFCTETPKATDSAKTNIILG